MQTDTLMKQLSFVFQDNFLFADTIAITFVWARRIRRWRRL